MTARLSLVEIAVASARVGGLVPALRMLSEQASAIEAEFPCLAPEMGAIRARVSEALDHADAAISVLSAQLELAS